MSLCRKRNSGLKKASEVLVKYAEEHESVVLVGHGFFNRLIAVELKKMGWEGKRKATAKHWHCTSYSYDEILVRQK